MPHQDFGNGTDEFQPLPEVEMLALSPYEMVKSLQSFLVVENQGRAVLSLSMKSDARKMPG